VSVRDGRSPRSVRDGLSARQYRRITVVALVLLCVIVASGAAVRLTDSGLGCDDWPNCNSTQLIDVSTKHAAIEQINRLFTGLVSLAVIGAVLGALYRRPRRRDLTWLAVGLVAGVLAQIVLGGITVLVDLHPAAVQGHLLLSMVLVANAVVLVVRAGRPDGRTMGNVVPRTRRRVGAVVLWTGLTIVAGTVVTGAGPHAGDEEARRFDLAITTVARVHSVIAWIAAAMALRLMWHLRRLPHDRQALDVPLAAWLVTAMLQGAVGYMQYAAGVPAGLVFVHVGTATVLWAITVWLWCSTTRSDALVLGAVGLE
jgi:heme a synthase